MADKASIVGSDDKGQFSIAVPRSSIDRVDVIDIDMVLHTKSGERLILPGAALEAMTAAPPAIRFSDGIVGADGLLSSVDRVQTPSTSIPAMTSLTEFDQKKTEGKKNRTDDGKDKADEAAQQAQSQQVAPLPVGSESSVDKLIAKAMDLEADLRKKAFDPAPPKVYEAPAVKSDPPGSQPPTAKIPLYISLAQGNVVDTTTTVISETLTIGGQTTTYTRAISGSGGPVGSAVANGIQPTDALQYGTETLTGTTGNDIIYADGFAGLTGYSNGQTTYANLDVNTGLPTTPGTHFYYAKEFMLTMAGYIRTVNSITMSDLPTGVVAIRIGTNTYAVNDGSVSIPNAAVIPDAQTITMIYDVGAVTAGTYEIKVKVSGQGVEPINVTRIFLLQFAAADDVTDITGNPPKYILQSGWSDYYVMETASAPHSIDAGDGDDLIYAGNSSDKVDAGDGNDIVLTYAGNDTVWAGNGNDIVWAGNGDDIVLAGSGINTVYGGAGADTLIGGAGSDSMEGGDGNDILYGGAGTNVLDAGAGTGDWVSFNGNAAITATTATVQNLLTLAGGDLTSVSISLNPTGGGNATQSSGSSTLSGVENIIGTSGADTINASAYAVEHILYGLDGDDLITGGALADTIYGGAGQDSILGGVGDDLINLAVTDITISGAGLAGTAVDVAGGSLTVNVSGAGITQTFTDIGNFADGGAGADTIYGGAGRDFFVATFGQTVNGSNTDWFYGGDGTDTIDFTSFTTALSVDLVSGTATGSGTVYAHFSSIERVLTGSVNDVVTGGGNAESIWTGTGDDFVDAGGGDDYIDLGSGTNSAVGGAGNDTIYGGSGVDRINTGIGDDKVWAGGGDDTIWSDGGNDTLYGEAGNDRFYGSTSAGDTVSMIGGTGTNTYAMYAGAEIVDASAGTDALLYNTGSNGTYIGTTVSGVSYGVFVNLSATDYGTGVLDPDDGDMLSDGATTSFWWNGSAWSAQMLTTTTSGQTWAWNADNDQRGFYANAQGDRYAGVENITGSNYSDVLIGNDSANYFSSSNGNDAMFGLGGNDTFRIPNGITNGSKYIDGGSGIDTLDLSEMTSSTPITINLATHTGTHVVYNVENIIGGSGDDILTGDASDNSINGGLGADTMTGGTGNDSYFVNSTSDQVSENAGEGTDTIYTTVSLTLTGNVENLANYNSTSSLTLTGNELDNTITAGSSSDKLYGGAGNDTLSVTNAQLSSVLVYGGNGGTGETGTDTLYISNGGTVSALNATRIDSIEAISVANNTTQDVTAFQAQGSTLAAKALIDGILDNAANTTLHVYLDNTDRFNIRYSDGITADNYATGSNSQATYNYTAGGQTSSITVHWGSG